MVCVIYDCGNPVDDAGPIEFSMPGGGTASASVCSPHREMLTGDALRGISLDVPQQTRPSAIVVRPMPNDEIENCSTAELLTEVIERARNRAAQPCVPAHHRELSLAIKAAEDCLTRHNKAVYMERGVFAITDAEIDPDKPRPVFS